MSKRKFVSVALTSISVLTMLLTVSTAQAGGERKKPSRAPDLYAGEPMTVHGTEYPVSSPEEGIHRGDVAWKQGNLDLAIYLYLQALELDPGNAGILRKIGAIHEGRGNNALARRAFELALQRGEHVETMERLALLYIADGDGDRAHEMLLRVVTIDGTRWRTLNGLGVLADRSGDYRLAITRYDQALAVQPNSPSILNNRGYSKFLAGQLNDAAVDLRAALAAGAGRPAWLGLAKVQAKEHDYKSALESFRQVLDAANAYNAVGETAMQNDEPAVARNYFERAAQASPSYFERAQKNLAAANQALSIGHVSGS